MAINFSAEEAATLKRWREIDAFQRQVALSKGNPAYTFFDGKFPRLRKMQEEHETDRWYDHRTTIRYRLTSLWSSSRLHYQRHHSPLLVYERLLCRTKIWLGYAWLAH